MRIRQAFPIAVTALAVVGLLLMIAWAARPGYKWPWSAEKTVTNSPVNSNADGSQPKTFSDTTFGLSFTYDSRLVGVRTENQKIRVFYRDYPEYGQHVQIFSKPASESLAEAIDRSFLTGEDDRCTVRALTIFETENSPGYPASYQGAEIAYPDNLGSPEGPWWDVTICPADYRVTNGMRYFLMDTEHPDRFFFFDIGQEGIPSGLGATSWHETFRVTPVSRPAIDTNTNESAAADLTVRLVNAQSDEPISNSSVEIYSETGERCVTEPCSTNGRTWRGTTNATGTVVVPAAQVDRYMIFMMAGFAGTELHQAGQEQANGSWVLKVPPNTTLPD